MSMQVESIAATIGGIYRTATTGGDWASPLGQLAHLFDGEFGSLELYNKQTGRPLFLAESSEIEVQQDYQQHFIASNPRIKLKASRPAAKIDCDYALMDEAGLSGDAFYEDFLGRYGLRYFLGMRVLETPDVFGVFTVQRAGRTGHPEEEDLELAEMLLPQLSGAAALFLRHLEQAQLVGSLGNGLAMLGEAMVIVGRDGQVISSTLAADGLFQMGDGVDATTGGLVFADPEANARMSRLLGDMSSQNGMPAVAERFVARRPSGAGALVVHVSPCCDPHLPAGMATIVIRDPWRPMALDEALVSGTFGLTPAEASLANALVNGVSLTRYADENAVSHNTVRSHVQSLMHKCNVSRQQDLAILLRAYRS